MLTEKLQRFPRIPLLTGATPLQKLERLSGRLGREIYVKRDDLTPFALGGNKVRKLEYLAADALRLGADTLVTAGAIQSNHVRQTAAVAARFGLHCVALLENPIATTDRNYLSNGNRLLLDLFATEVRLVANLDHAAEDLQAVADELAVAGRRPYVVPVGGSNALGALGYVGCGLEIADQARRAGLDFAAVVVPSGSAGTHAGLALGLAERLPETPLIGVTVSRPRQTQAPKVADLIRATVALLGAPAPSSDVKLWDEYFAPGYGVANVAGTAAIRLLAATEGLLLDPVYTGKAMAGLLDGLGKGKFAGRGPLLFVHTGGSPALFAYHPAVG